jgi:hypothetical protein
MASSRAWIPFESASSVCHVTPLYRSTIGDGNRAVAAKATLVEAEPVSRADTLCVPGALPSVHVAVAKP